MDKFVIRLPRPAPSPVATTSRRDGKQITLESLKGVVVIEEIERAKVIMSRDVSSDLIITTLKALEKKRPSKEILVKTEIGKSVHKLCRHADPEVAACAKNVYSLWKSHILSKNNRPMIEVKCDARTEYLRTKARQMILDSINTKFDSDSCVNNFKFGNCSSDVSVENKNRTSSLPPEKSELENLRTLAEHIEREVFRIAKKRVNYSYKRTNRKIIFALKYQKELNKKVVTSVLSVEKLVQDHFQE